MQFTLQLAIVLACLFYGARKGGIALGLLGGIGLVILVFAFGLPPGKPPVEVMLTIIAVVAASATLQASGGLEVMLQLMAGSHWSAQLSYSYLNPDILTAFNPENMFKYYLSYHHRRLSLSLFGKNISKLYADNYSRSQLTDYELINFSGSVTTRGLSFDIQLRNLLDKKYEVLPGYPAPQFHILAGITFNWIYKAR